MELHEVIAAIGKMDRPELEAVFAAANTRQRAVRQETALVNMTTLKPGTRVITRNLKPKYLNGLKGTVQPQQARRAGDLAVLVDESDRFLLGRYRSHDGIVNVPASSLAETGN